MAVRALFLKFPTSVKHLQLDRQTGFLTQSFTSFLINYQTSFSKAPPERHEEFNGLAERALLTLKKMARAALLNSNLSSSFWKYATAYAAF